MGATAAAVTPAAISSHPYARKGRRQFSRWDAKNQLPAAKPRKTAHSVAVVAGVVAPNSDVRRRIQSTS